MNFFQRAVLYLTRKKGRTVLLTALLFLMSCCVCLGVSFKKNAEEQTDRLRKSLAAGFILEANTENELYHERIEYERGGGSIIYTGPVVTDEMIDKILSLDGVKGYFISLHDIAWTSLELRKGSWSAQKPDDEEQIAFAKKMGGGWMTEEELMVWQKQVRIDPCSDGGLHPNFRMGAITIARGRNIKEGDHYKAVISEWLAEKNGLSIGDTFTVETKEGMWRMSEEPMKTWGERIPLEIVGIFRANFSQKSSESTSEDCYIENMIYADMDTYAKLEENEKGVNLVAAGDGYKKVEFFVEDLGELDAIMQRVENWEELDLNNLELEVDSSAYQASVRPYQRIRIFAMLLLGAGLAGLGVILSLVLKLWVQGRQQEACILFSVGIKKREIFGQMLTESLIVSAASLILAFVLAGPLLSGCAGAMERIYAPKEEIEAYEAATGGYHLEIKKTSSDEVVLEKELSIGTMCFTMLFVCGVSALGVCLSFRSIQSQELGKFMRLM